MTDSADWLAWAVLSSSVWLLITESTVATRAWMFAGYDPPIPAASVRTLAAAASVAAYQCWRALGSETGSSPAVSSRSSSRACTRPVTCCPRAASCDTWPNSSALSVADTTRRPPKTKPMSRASTITAIRRVDTGQFRRVSARGLVKWEVGASIAYWLALPARGAALATLWFPIADVLAVKRFLHAAVPAQSTHQHQRPPAALMQGAANFSGTGCEISGKC